MLAPPANRTETIACYGERMRTRVFVYSVLLLAGLVVLAVRAGIVDRARDRFAYAGLVAGRGNEDDASRDAMLAHYDRVDSSVSAGVTYFIGDSIAFRAPFGGPCVANRGIGGERSDQLLANLDRWPSLARAGAVAVSIGTNDVWQRRPEQLGANVRALIERIEAPTYLIGLTADIEGIAEANEVLRRACVGTCTFIQPVGALAKDSIHLAPNGYAQIAARTPLRCQGKPG